MSSIELTNDEWAFHIVDQLVKQKVYNFCIAPGSRSSPLTLAIAKRKDIKVHVHFDERGLGFYALGFAKASKKPTAIVVTSGTAVGNLFPAIMEASQSHLPLIIITADRPMELQDCEANQTIDQAKIFQGFVKWQTDISPSSSVSVNYIRSVISYGVFKSTNYPIHINCRFKEPLYSVPQNNNISPIPTIDYFPLKNTFSEQLAENVIQKINKCQKGLIIVSKADSKSINEIIETAKLLNWPIYIEVLSRANISNTPDTFLYHLPYLLEFFPDQFRDLDCVLQFGERIISKKILNWLSKASLKNYFLITEHSKKSDEFHLISDRIITPLKPFVEQLSKRVCKKQNDLLAKVKELDLIVHEEINNQISKYKPLSEQLLYQLFNSLKLSECSVFLGNSSIIRDANTLFFPDNQNSKIFANRGVSGIDGNIATLSGITSQTNTPMVAILGDLTFLHDLNSIPLLKSQKNPITLFVINNNGGEIFSQLPVVNFQMYFDKFFKTPHNLNFSKIAEFFSIEYYCISSSQSLKKHLESITFQNTQIIELKVDATCCRFLRKTIDNSLKETLCFPTKNMEALKTSP